MGVRRCRAGKSLSLAVSIFSGIGMALWVSQILWMESTDNRANAYAHRLLAHAETVASNVTDALTELNKMQTPPCSKADLREMKSIIFTYRFVKDAGRINNNQILCSALWGKLDNFAPISAKGKLTANQIKLWSNIPNYAIADSLIDISASQGSYVVTSPTAFSPYEDSSLEEYSAIIASKDGQHIMRRFDQDPPRAHTLTTRIKRVCSTRFDICVTGQVTSNIFSWSRAGLLSFLMLLGGGSGALLWYALMQLSANRKTLAVRLTTAIQTDAIRLVYQPIVQAATGKVHGMEALARWNDKVLGEVPPDTFIRKAGEIGLGKELNLRLIKKALKECRAHLLDNPGLYLSLNLDSESLTTPSIISSLIAETQKCGISCHQIAIEVLEDSTTDMQMLEGVITHLRTQGYQVFIDDFGTGYSSLSYLSNLQIDKIKIDRSFTRSAGTQSPAAKVLRKIHEIADSLNTPIIFEGIETEAQLKAILAFCPDALAQGWLYSKGVPLEQLENSYRANVPRYANGKY